MVKKLIGTIKNNAKDDWNLVSNLEILMIQIEEDSKELLVISPIRLNEMEKFFKTMHDTFGKENFFEDYNTFVCYYFSEDCDDIVLTIDRNDVERIREANEEDIFSYNSNLELLKNNCNWEEFINDN